MKHYWCFLCVRFLHPRLVQVGTREEVLRAEGYVRRIGLSVRQGSELRRILADVASDGRVSWKRTEVERIRRYDLGVRTGPGVWYCGGPFYFA